MPASHLTDEARYLHAALFYSHPLDELTIERYAAAHATLFPETSQSPLMRTVLSRSLDAKAVEVSLRRKYGANLLTRKMQVLCYLVEIQPDYRREFVNLEPSTARAWFGIVFAAIQGTWKSLKGAWLIKRYGLR